MNQASNHLTEASEGEYGKGIAEKIQKRMDWVVNAVEGSRILDVGCNQGKVSIMLGRAGKKVIGVDTDEDSIRFARQSLEKEPEEVKKNVRFEKMDVLEEQLKEDGFDTVIVSEVLEQYESSAAMLEAVSHLMKENGKIIVTVPFGIRHYSDNKRVFYFQDIYQEVKQLFKVTEVEFTGDSICLTGRLSSNKNRGPVPVRFIQRLEEAFYQLEKQLQEENMAKDSAMLKLKQEKEQLKTELMKNNEVKNQQPVADREKEARDHISHPGGKSGETSADEKNKKLLEVNRELRDQLIKSQELNKQQEKELKQLHETNTALNQKWTEKFQDLKKQTEMLIQRYKAHIEKLKMNQK